MGRVCTRIPDQSPCRFFATLLQTVFRPCPPSPHPTRVLFGDGMGRRLKGQRKKIGNRFFPERKRSPRVAAHFAFPPTTFIPVSLSRSFSSITLPSPSPFIVILYLAPYFSRVFSLLFIYSLPFGHKRSTYIVRHTSRQRGLRAFPCHLLLGNRLSAINQTPTLIGTQTRVAAVTFDTGKV